MKFNWIDFSNTLIFNICEGNPLTFITDPGSMNSDFIVNTIVYNMLRTFELFDENGIP